MAKKLTITVDDGARESPPSVGTRWLVLSRGIINGYRAMAAEAAREGEAAEWSDNLIGDVADDHLETL
jgi:hypothetical protein